MDTSHFKSFKFQNNFFLKKFKKNKNLSFFTFNIKHIKKTLLTIQKFKKPTKYSKPIAKLDTGRLLLIQKCEKSWCNVKTEKFSGWIDKNNIWGSTE